MVFQLYGDVLEQLMILVVQSWEKLGVTYSYINAIEKGKKISSRSLTLLFSFITSIPEAIIQSMVDEVDSLKENNVDSQTIYRLTLFKILEYLTLDERKKLYGENIVSKSL